LLIVIFSLVLTHAPALRPALRTTRQTIGDARSCLPPEQSSFGFHFQNQRGKEFGAKHRKADRPSPLMRRAVAAQQVEDLRNGRETKNVRAFCTIPADAINTIRPPTQQCWQPYFL